MMGHLKGLFYWSTHKPVTPKDVAPAPRPAEKEEQIKTARGQFVGELMRVERKANEIRHELANSALRIVAGDY